MSSYIKAMNIFKEKNPELLLAEQLKPRSLVVNIDEWEYGKNVPDFHEEDLRVIELPDSDDGIFETFSDSSEDEIVVIES